jgi:hypothetical protein
VVGLVALSGLAACDDDPTAPTPLAFTAQVVGDSIIGIQEPLRVRFSAPVDPRTALDPENFVVINQCTGLRVAGALRLSETGDTLVFSPSTALPFLTPLAIRVQNVLTTNGQALLAPFTFVRETAPPPVVDQTWEFLDPFTDDFVSSVSFVNEDLGYATTRAGEVYRTVTGGGTFAAVFKNADISATRGIRAASADTVYMLGSTTLGGMSFTTAALFRSVDSARDRKSVV